MMSFFSKGCNRFSHSPAYKYLGASLIIEINVGVWFLVFFQSYISLLLNNTRVP